LEVVDGQRRVELGRPTQRAVLAVLLVHANQVVGEALGLWRGPALADVADEAFAQAERQQPQGPAHRVREQYIP
jgi:hypothetical protein